MKKLSDEQVEAFDREYVDENRFARICQKLDSDFPDGQFSFLDVGGGNGCFCDQLLARYPEAHGTVLDNSELLLARNRPHARKSLAFGSAMELGAIPGTYDVLALHWLLHHLVGNSYAESRANQLASLRAVRGMLTERGRVSLFENDYVGWAPDPLPTVAIYHATASKLAAPLAKALGANTAGVGVCFNSREGWQAMIRESGLALVDHAEPDNWRRRLHWYTKVFVGLKDVRVGHYWLRSDASTVHR